MDVSVTPSVGISFFPQDGIELDSLLNAADAAMYQAKESGRQTYAFYTPTVARRADLRLRLEQRLRKAVEARDFKLVYQPLISLNDGKLVGAEALIRWRDAELGDISPAEFIPIAEESGLIVALGEWVMHEACRARRDWRMQGLDIPPLSINMSGVQLRQLGCVEGLLNILNEYEVSPNDIEIEVTETGLLDTSAVSRENLVRMRNAGVRIALDDFGVGFSSLAHLRDLPIHRLKIDRSFTVECMRDARTLTIVKAVIDMARSLGISITAEGIETQAQQTWMQHLGCDSAQGYLFARPMNVDDFVHMFIDRRGVGRERIADALAVVAAAADAAAPPTSSGTSCQPCGTRNAGAKRAKALFCSTAPALLRSSGDDSKAAHLRQPLLVAILLDRDVFLTPTPEMLLAQAFGRGAALGVVEERSTRRGL